MIKIKKLDRFTVRNDQANHNSARIINFITDTDKIKEPLRLVFISSGRDSTSIYAFHEESVIVEELDVKYAALTSGLVEPATKFIDDVLAFYRCSASDNLKDYLIDEIRAQVAFCESRYGYSVKDYDKFEGDAVITITGDKSYWSQKVKCTHR